MFGFFWLFPILVFVGAVLRNLNLVWTGCGIGTLLILLMIFEIKTGRHILPRSDQIYGKDG